MAFRVFAPDAAEVTLCLFDAEGREEQHPMARAGEDFAATVPKLRQGARYGYRASGPWAPERGLWFDPAKLLADPYATSFDGPWIYTPDLATAARGVDTAALVPKTVVELPPIEEILPPVFRPGGLIYEVNVRGYTMRHPGVPETERGTLRGLTHPEIIAHLKALGVGAIELMPVTAWIDERHLAALGLRNAWGYNPVTFMALDPRLAPGGTEDLCHLVQVMRANGIGVILDLVFNHTAESDLGGPTLSLRGLCNAEAYRHAEDGALVNDTGCGNTVDCSHPAMRRLVLDSLRHFAMCGVDGFRFDLAPILGRDAAGFSPDAPLLAEMRADPVIGSRILIAEPWDIGPGGYQLGQFRPPFLEWNDRFRDCVRRFWRGDDGMLGELATVLSGSSDVFDGAATRSVNFIAAHDGFTLADLVAHEQKHNDANGEGNRDGHGENLSWNNGAEGATEDPAIVAARHRDLKALLATLFLSRGTILLTAGDEFGRSQGGNNNAYAQDNATTWVDWKGLDRPLLEHARALAQLRRDWPVLRETRFLSGAGDVVWLTASGSAMKDADWHAPEEPGLAMILTGDQGARLAILINRQDVATEFALPAPRHRCQWVSEIGTGPRVGPRSIHAMTEQPE